MNAWVDFFVVKPFARPIELLFRLLEHSRKELGIALAVGAEGRQLSRDCLGLLRGRSFDALRLAEFSNTSLLNPGSSASGQQS